MKKRKYLLKNRAHFQPHVASSLPAQQRKSQHFFFLEGSTHASSRSLHGVHHIVASLDTGVGVKGLLEQSYKCFQFLEDSVYVETMDD